MLVIKLKKLILPISIMGFILGLLVFASSNLPAVKSSLNLWANSVVPSLFPFFVATELLMHTNLISYFEIVFKNFMKPLFNVSGKCSFAFLMGLLSGYPMGAKIACDFRKKNICSKEECERLLSFTNNSGPLFVIGAVGVSMFGNFKIGILLYITHVLASITVGILFRFWKTSKSKEPTNSFSYNNNYLRFSTLGGILSQSITSAISTILMIGGFIIVFSCVTTILKGCGIITLIQNLFTPLFSFLKIDPAFISPLATGIIEITEGVFGISNILIKDISYNLVFASFLIGMGGVSVFLQVWSIVAKTDLSIRPYFYGKIMQGIFASIYTFGFINIFGLAILA